MYNIQIYHIVEITLYNLLWKYVQRRGKKRRRNERWRGQYRNIWRLL